MAVKGLIVATTPPEDHTDKRKERYNHLRELGFDARNSNRLKDQSGPNIERAISARLRNLSNRKRLNEKERAALSALETRTDKSAQQTIERTFSTRDRQAQFEEWTSNKSFPEEIVEAIQQINDSSGLSESDGFGYRRYYYEFVKREPAGIAAKLADRDDS